MSEQNGDWPVGWVCTTLDEIGTLYCGQSPPSNTVNGDGKGTVYVTGPEQWDGERVWTDKWTTDPRRIVPDGCIFVMVKGAGVGTIFPGIACAIGRDIYAYCPSKSVLSAFIQHALHATIDEIKRQAQGDIPGLSKNHLLKHEIGFPPRAEQHRIVTKIETLQERSRRVRKALAEVGPLLEQFRRSVLAAAIRGDLTADWRAVHPTIEPASELLHRIRAERRRQWEQAELAKYEAKGQKPPKNWQDKYEEPEPVDYSNLPELPERWQWSNFDEVSLIDGGLTKHEAKRSKATIFVPLISVAAVQHGYIDPTQVSEIGLLPTDGDKGKLETDDLLVVEGNGSLEHIGRAALWDGSIENARHQNHLIRVRPVLLDPRFCLHWLGSPRGRTNLVAEATSAAGLYNLSLGKIGRVYIPIPPLDEQMEIIKQLDTARTALRSIFALQRTTVNDLDSLDQSILAKAFRGELVPQDHNDEPASVLLERIRAQREQQAEAIKQTSKTQQRNKTGKQSPRLTPQQLTLVEAL